MTQPPTTTTTKIRSFDDDVDIASTRETEDDPDVPMIIDDQEMSDNMPHEKEIVDVKPSSPESVLNNNEFEIIATKETEVKDSDVELVSTKEPDINYTDVTMLIDDQEMSENVPHEHEREIVGVNPPPESVFNNNEFEIISKKETEIENHDVTMLIDDQNISETRPSTSEFGVANNNDLLESETLKFKSDILSTMFLGDFNLGVPIQ